MVFCINKHQIKARYGNGDILLECHPAIVCVFRLIIINNNNNASQIPPNVTRCWCVHLSIIIRSNAWNRMAVSRVKCRRHRVHLCCYACDAVCISSSRPTHFIRHSRAKMMADHHAHMRLTHIRQPLHIRMGAISINIDKRCACFWIVCSNGCVSRMCSVVLNNDLG